MTCFNLVHTTKRFRELTFLKYPTASPTDKMVEKMNERSLKGVTDILSKLDDEELFGLANTVTNHLLKNKVDSKEDAIHNILRYSPNVISILRRRAVTRDILFYYLHENNVAVPLPPVKDKLIQILCSFWKISINDDDESIASTPEPKEPQKKETDEVNLMAQKFSEWFYELMNQNECIGSEHFFPDATLQLNIFANVNSLIEVESPAEIVKVLFQTKSDHMLYFNPNLNNQGVKGRIDAHGLVLIFVCGTLHSNNICKGVFEQMFALARDPFCENNWKIKKTQLYLRSTQGISEVPTLLSDNHTDNILVLPET